MEEKIEKTEIPKINITEGNVILDTIEIPLNINGKEEMITLQKLTSGKRRDLAKKYLNTRIVGQQLQGTMDSAGYQIGFIKNIIIKAPFEITEGLLANFPDDVLDYIYNQYCEWTGDSKKKLD